MEKVIGLIPEGKVRTVEPVSVKCPVVESIFSTETLRTLVPKTASVIGCWGQLEQHRHPKPVWEVLAACGKESEGVLVIVTSAENGRTRGRLLVDPGDFVYIAPGDIHQVIGCGADGNGKFLAILPCSWTPDLDIPVKQQECLVQP